jgi:hypothetical protein
VAVAVVVAVVAAAQTAVGVVAAVAGRRVPVSPNASRALR